MAKTIKATRYMGVKIKPVVSCDMAAQGYRCYIQAYHPTGMPYSHDVCAHYRTVKAAKEAIREAARHEARAQTIDVEVTVGEATYSATVDAGRVSIYRIVSGSAHWSGDGRWDGARIVDCAADIGDDVYDALDEAISDDMSQV